ncbi:MAG: hypothetical protein HOV80_39705 [Polyangiaceae bacterium]|nr:hypothetical protein [Polyangiaceae bacterium]
MQRGALYFLLPAAATVLVTVVLLGPGQERAPVGGRVLVAGSPDGAIRSLRIETVERGSPFQRHVELDGLVLKGPDGAALWNGSSGPYGVAEVELASELPSGSHIELQARGGRVLAEGAIEAPVAAPPEVKEVALVGVQEGALGVTAELPTGALVPSLRGSLLVTVTLGKEPVENATLVLHGSSVEPAEAKLEYKGPRTPIDLVVIAPPAVVEIEASGARGTGKLRVEIPTEMGAIGASSDGASLDLVSPSPRDVAYVSFYDERGRIGGVTVPLEATPDGFFRGSAQPGRDFVAMTVASDPHESSASTMTWPGPSHTGVASAPKLVQALDGMPIVVRAEKQRVGRVRTITTIALSLAAALQIALLIGSRRAAKAESARIDAESSPSDDNADENILHSRPTARSTSAFVAAMAGLILLAFAAVLGLVVLR